MAANTSAVNTNFAPLPTVAEIVAAIQAQIQNAVNGLPSGSLITNFNGGGAAETFIESVAIALGVDSETLPGSTVAGAYSLLENVRNAAYILTAKGQYLDAKAADVGVYRKAASLATSTGVFVPAAGSAPPGVDTVIPAGTIVGAPSGDPTAATTTYATATAITYPANAAQSPAVAITAVQAGSAGNNPIAGAISQVVNGPPGLAFSNTVAATGGYDQEGDDTPNGGLRGRALAAIPNGDCTLGAIEQAALAYSGVMSAYLKENTDADGVSFLRGRGQLYVDDGSGNMALNNPALISKMQIDFDSGLNRAASTQVDVRGSVLIAVTVVLSIFHSAAFVSAGTGTVQTIAAAVQAAVFAYVNSVPIGRAVTLAGVLEAAGTVSGVANVVLTSVKLNGQAADLIPAVNQSLRCASAASVTVNDLGSSALYG